MSSMRMPDRQRRAGAVRARSRRSIAKLGDGFLFEVYGSTELGVVTVLPPEDQLRKPGLVRQALRRRSRCGSSGTTAPRPPPASRASCSSAPGSRWTATTAPRSSSPSSTDGAWKSVGDVAYVDDEGYLYICDRKKDMIISGGVNIYPAEIEAVLHAPPAGARRRGVRHPRRRVGRVGARDRPGHGGGDDRPRRGPRVRRRATSPKYKRPRGYELRDELPRTDSGKLLKRVLRDEYWADRDQKV